MRNATDHPSILIVATDPVFAAVLSGELERYGFAPTYLGSRFPARTDAQAVLSLYAPTAIFVELVTVRQCAEVAGAVTASGFGIPVIAAGRNCDPDLIADLHEAGISEFLAWPLEASCVRGTLDRARSSVRTVLSSHSDVHAFLPAKGGSGATTLAFNVAFALGHLMRPVLLADFDFTGGTTRLMLRTSGGPSAVRALEQAGAMHPLSWRDLVANYGDVDLLHSGPFEPAVRVQPGDGEALLSFAKGQYRSVCLDLSGSFEPHSLELMDAAQTVYVVCTPEPASLMLAREKVSWLRDRGCGGTVKLLLNRHCRKSMPIEQIEETVGIVVDFTFPNDFNSVARSVLQSAPVPAMSDLGRQCHAFARRLAEGQGSFVAEEEGWLQRA